MEREKGEGEGWRDRNRGSKRVRGRYKSVFHGWLCCYGNKMWAPYSQKSVLLPSSLPSLLSLSLSLVTSFLSSSSSRRPQHLSPLSLSPPITSHHMPPLSLSLSLPPSLSQSLILSSVIHPFPAHSFTSLSPSLCPFSSSPPLLLPRSSPDSLSVLPSLPPLFPSLSFSLWSLCLFNTHLYSILFSVVMAIGWGREGASASKRAGVGVSEVTSLGQ